jgi:predicted TIM-barrel fold metal-dependent hydrolase
VHRLAKAVHIEAFPTDGLAEVRHVMALANASASDVLRGIVAHADLAAPGVGEQLQQLANFPLVRGVRHALNRSGDTRSLLDEPDWRAGFGLLAQHGLSFELQLSPPQAEKAAELIARHGSIPVALNHMGWPKDRDLQGWRAWRHGLRTLARIDHVWVKISGPGMFDPAWTVESVKPYAFEALEAFGVERAMFASNFPVDRRWSSYARVWESFAEIVASLRADQQSRLLRGNAETFYRI